ncbi:histidine kinase [Streptomyces mashuensis]|uniref:histidine kinase n=1 Tax=Streptomyces mashuensis TaxID=33904 RepID=A0A919B6R7_9ACTN|nr:sensor histidine kinase [Streptomyces mashuensis]GHF56946.1 histidine kinase [Streptomyces mashuensis]
MNTAIDHGPDATATAAAHRPHRVPAVLRAPLEGRTWGELLYALTGFPIATALFCIAITLTATSAGLLVTFIGVPLLAFTLAGARGMGVLERARARALLGQDVAAPEPLRLRARRSRSTGLMAWVGALLKDGTSWRHLVYALVCFPWAVLTFVTAVTLWSVGWALFTYPVWQWTLPRFAHRPGMQIWGDSHGRSFYLDTPYEIGFTCALGFAVVMASPWILRSLTQVNRLLVSGLLGPSRLAERVWELEEDRGVAEDTAAADLRRIERKLHDGAQARLAHLAVGLDMAKETALADPPSAVVMVEHAHGEVKRVLQELRDLARGIHPAILTDRGLGPALSALAARCSVPVTTEVGGLPSRPASAIEGIAYFTVSELLENISKHSGATTASVDVWRSGNRLMLRVADDGRGGALIRPGGGLAGLTDRLRAVDGVLDVDSVPGGPTVVTAELPWRP